MTKESFEEALDSINGEAVIVFMSDDDVCIRKVRKDDKIEFHPESFNQTFFYRVRYSDVICVVKAEELRAIEPYFGSDPEFFYKKDGRVVPSKSILPPYRSNVSPDGFQVEINPTEHSCRQVSGQRIGQAMREADEYAVNADAEICLDLGVKIDREVFYAMPPEERRFGCNPTDNPYENKKVGKGTRTRFRSGGGHIHLGNDKISRYAREDRKSLVQLLDIICGNTLVLLDRDPLNAKRRKHYGRAGEHRVKSYGIEYRVPSNFWLRNYTLWSTVSVLCRNAVNLYGSDAGKDLLANIKITDVRKAINENDYDLALSIYDKVSAILDSHKVVFNGGLSFYRLGQFRKWATQEDPLAYFSSNVEDIIYHWTEIEEEYHDFGVGLEKFLDYEFPINR